MSHKTRGIRVGSDPANNCIWNTYAPMLDVLLLSLELLHLRPSCGGIISCHKPLPCKIVAIATYANVQTTLQGESLRVQAGLGRLHLEQTSQNERSKLIHTTNLSVVSGVNRCGKAACTAESLYWQWKPLSWLCILLCGSDNGSESEKKQRLLTSSENL